MKFRPLHDRVLVESLDSEEKTAGGIIIPDTAKEKPQEGKVIAVGPGSKSEDGKITPMDVKVGDHILFGKWLESLDLNGFLKEPNKDIFWIYRKKFKKNTELKVLDTPLKNSK